MNLADGDEGRGGTARSGLSEEGAVLDDRFPAVSRGEAEVELAGSVLRAVGAAEAAHAGTESVP